MRLTALIVVGQLASGFTVQSVAAQQRQIVAEATVAPPPDGLAAFRDRSDAVILVSATSDRPSQYRPAQIGPDLPITIHDMRLKQTLKSHQGLPADGEVISVIERAGTIETATTRTTTSESVNIVPGADYVLFLRWNQYFGQFELQNGAHGIYRIKLN